MPPAEHLRTMLSVGRQQIHLGRTCEAVALVRAQPRKARQLMECLWDDDLGVASRAADALEEVTRDKPSLLAPWKDELVGLLSEATQNKLRWSLALIVPRCRLSYAECERVAQILVTYLEDPSSIVKTCALQGLADLTVQAPALLPSVLDLVCIHSRSGTPAMRARGRKLQLQLEKQKDTGIAAPISFRTVRRG